MLRVHRLRVQRLGRSAQKETAHHETTNSQFTFLGHVADTSDTCVPGRSLGAALSEGDAEEPDPPHWAAWCLRGQCAGASGQDGSVPAGVEPAASLHLGAAAGLDAVRAGWRLVIGDACALRGMRFAHFVKLYALLFPN